MKNAVLYKLNPKESVKRLHWHIASGAFFFFFPSFLIYFSHESRTICIQQIADIDVIFR